MLTCDGWIKCQHGTSEVTEISLKPCKHCGGGECGDTGETLYLCNNCLSDLQSGSAEEGSDDAVVSLGGKPSGQAAIAGSNPAYPTNQKGDLNHEPEKCDSAEQ